MITSMFPLFTDANGAQPASQPTAAEPDANDADGFASLLAAMWGTNDAARFSVGAAAPANASMNPETVSAEPPVSTSPTYSQAAISSNASAQPDAGRASVRMETAAHSLPTIQPRSVTTTRPQPSAAASAPEPSDFDETPAPAPPPVFDAGSNGPVLAASRLSLSQSRTTTRPQSETATQPQSLPTIQPPSLPTMNAPEPSDFDATLAPAPPPVFDVESGSAAGTAPPALASSAPPATFDERADDEIPAPTPQPELNLDVDEKGTTPPPITYTPPPSDADAYAGAHGARHRANGLRVGVENGSRMEFENRSGVEVVSGSGVEVENVSGVEMKNGTSVELIDAGVALDRSGRRSARQSLFEFADLQRSTVAGARTMLTVSAIKPLLFERGSADAEVAASGDISRGVVASAQDLFAGKSNALNAGASVVSRSDSAGATDAVLSNENAEMAAAQIVESAERLAPQQERAVRLRLRPEELGAVEMLLTRDAEGRLSARLTVETDAALQVVNEGLGSLRESLERAGVAIDRLDVNAGADSHRHQATAEGDRREGVREPRRIAVETSSEEGGLAVKTRAVRERLLSVRV